jgi:LysM repeat protein
LSICVKTLYYSETPITTEGWEMPMRKLAPLLCALILAVCVTVVGAQSTTNLLTNPGFEAPFVSAGGTPDRQVAQGWTPWHTPAANGMPSFQNMQPDYSAVAPNQPRVREGGDAQQLSATFGTFDGGVYQRVTGLTRGAQLQFSIFAYVWSSSQNDLNVSEDDGDVLVRVGIDPTGGTDPNSATIIWSAPTERYDAYSQYSISATAGAAAATVFVQATIGAPVLNSFVYLDSALLTATSGDGGILPTNTSAPTPVPPTATINVVATATTLAQTLNAPTRVPTNTAAAATTAPTNTASAPTTIPTNTASAPTTIPTNTLTVPTQEVVATRITIASPTPQTGGGGVTPIPAEFPSTLTHRVQRGDTVGRLANLYGSTTAAIAQANGLDENFLIYVNQSLIVPVRLAAPATATPTTQPTALVITATPRGFVASPTPRFGTGGPSVPSVYIVQAGDTLFSIARRFNATPAAIAQLNGIVNPNLVFVGQRLNVPGGSGAPASPFMFPTPFPTAPPPPVIIVTATGLPTNTPAPTVPGSTAVPTAVAGGAQRYTVQAGDTLYSLSLRFGVSMLRIAEANGILNANRIFVGQVLDIPAP